MKLELTAKYDEVFKKIMYENKEVLIKVLENILDERIEDIKYLNTELSKNRKEEKGKILDLCVETKNEYIDIEVNNGYNIYIRRRNLTYGCQLYCRSIKKGTRYKDYKNIKIINLIWNKSNKREIVYSYLKDDENNITTNSLLYCEIYMDNLIKKYYNKDVNFISKYKYIIMLGLGKNELIKLSKGDEIVNKYKNQLEQMEDIYLEPLVTEEYDRKMFIEAEKDEARLEKQQEIAKNLLNKEVDINLIMECTGLSKEEIQKL